MTTDLSPLGIRRLLDICERATEAPWYISTLTENRMNPNSPVFECVSNQHGQVLFRAHRVAEQAEHDVVCIAAARTALPDALMAVQRLTADCCSLQSQLDAANEGAWEYERRLNAALKCLQEIADMHVGDQPAALAHYSEADWVRRHAVMMQHIAYTAVKAIVADEAAKPKPVDSTAELVAALKGFLFWAQTRCPCENEEPNPCTLCGASIENLEGCKAVDRTIPPDILGEARAALAKAGAQ